jgi:hypothetical protein
MKNKSYFVDRIIKLRGTDAQRDELMNLTMVDILTTLNQERAKQSETVQIIPFDDDEEVPGTEEEDFVSIVKRFLFTSPD